MPRDPLAASSRCEHWPLARRQSPTRRWAGDGNSGTGLPARQLCLCLAKPCRRRVSRMLFGGHLRQAFARIDGAAARAARTSPEPAVRRAADFVAV